MGGGDKTAQKAQDSRDKHCVSAVPTRPIPFDVAPGEALFNPRGLKFRVCLSSPSESDGGNDEEERVGGTRPPKKPKIAETNIA